MRGGEGIATEIANRLFTTGFRVLVIDIEKPLINIKRKVSFTETIYSGEIEVNGIKALLTDRLEVKNLAIQDGYIPVLVDEKKDRVEFS